MEEANRDLKLVMKSIKIDHSAVHITSVSRLCAFAHSCKCSVMSDAGAETLED